MNKVIIPSSNIGGHPLSQTDLRYMQDAIFEAFKGIASLAGSSLTDTYILYGCDVTVAGLLSYNVSEGFMIYQGEVCKVDAHTFTGALLTAKWNVSEAVFDAGSSRAYKSGAVYETRQIRKAKLVNLIGGGGVLYGDVKRFNVKLLDVLATAYSWQELAFSSPFENYEAAGVNDCKVKLDKINGIVHMKGRFKRSPAISLAADVQVATLPDASLFPVVDRYVCAASVGANFTGYKALTYIIKTDGSVWIKATAVSIDSGDMFFDGISFPL